MDEWLTSKEAASEAGYTEQRIRELAGKGRFPGAVKRGRDWFIPRTGFERYLLDDRDRRRRKGTNSVD